MQDQYNIHPREKFLTYLVAGILLFIVVLLPFDTYEFLNKPKDYIHVYDLDTTQKYWQFQYLRNNLITFPLCFIGLIIIIASSKNKSNRSLKTVRRLVVAITLSLMIYGFYQSYQSGFDH